MRLHQAEMVLVVEITFQDRLDQAALAISLLGGNSIITPSSNLAPSTKARVLSSWPELMFTVKKGLSPVPSHRMVGDLFLDTATPIMAKKHLLCPSA